MCQNIELDMEPQDTEQQKPNRALSIFCFLLPIALTLPAFFIEGFIGLLGFIGIFVSAFLAGYILLFRPSRKIKQAAWSHLFGVAIAISTFILGAYASLSGQSSPWLQ